MQAFQQLNLLVIVVFLLHGGRNWGGGGGGGYVCVCICCSFQNLLVIKLFLSGMVAITCGAVLMGGVCVLQHSELPGDCGVPVGHGGHNLWSGFDGWCVCVAAF